MGDSILAVAGRDAKSLHKCASPGQDLQSNGGGKIAGACIEKARTLGVLEMFCDTINIGETKLSSFLMAYELPTIAEN